LDIQNNGPVNQSEMGEINQLIQTLYDSVNQIVSNIPNPQPNTEGMAGGRKRVSKKMKSKRRKSNKKKSMKKTRKSYKKKGGWSYSKKSRRSLRGGIILL
jgi:hypothetical protein